MKLIKFYTLITSLSLFSSCGDLSTLLKSTLPMASHAWPPTESSVPVAIKTSLPSPKTITSENTKPIIQQVLPNPLNIATANDVITLKALSYDKDNDTLRLIWTATKGSLSSNQGESITWKPQKSNGELETGLATITVLVDDNKGGIDSASVNIIIDRTGAASVEEKQADTNIRETESTPSPSNLDNAQATPKQETEASLEPQSKLKNIPYAQKLDYAFQSEDRYYTSYLNFTDNRILYALKTEVGVWYGVSASPRESNLNWDLDLYLNEAPFADGSEAQLKSEHSEPGGKEIIYFQAKKEVYYAMLQRNAPKVQGSGPYRFSWFLHE